MLVGIASRGLEQLGEEVTNSQFRLLSVLGEYGPIASVEAAGWLGSAGSSVTALRKIVSRGQLYHSTSVSGEPGRAADLMNPP
ncbi:MAG: hypothetical protein QOE59_5365 [Actinomycetota bacterium]|nr:hypothetical protein [Actinomycetota bacterium]